ncbi:MAG: hypothetical protein AB1941_30265 [Gemmatimonadota bacterium]
MSRTHHLPSITGGLRGAVRRHFGPEPARTLIGAAFAAALFAFYVLYVVTHWK